LKPGAANFLIYNDPMPFQLSRRRWFWLMGSTPLLAQTPAPVVPAGPPSQKARDEIRQVSEKLAAIEVPMNVEPAFRFVA
jgi:hypothetical protein